jgi:predicted RecA/RadA family phage recombinase
MKNYLSEGNVIDVPAPAGGAKSGDFAMVGAMFGCFVTSAAEGEQVGLCRVGKFEAALDGADVAQGAKLYWKADPGIVTGVATGNTKIGFAAAGSALSKVEIVLVPTVV